MNRRLFLIGGIGAFVLAILLIPHPTQAAILDYLDCNLTIPGGINRACGVADFLNLFVYLAQWGLSIVAVLAVGMLVYGGFQFLVAGGRSSKIDEGKRVIVGTFVGVIISLTAYVIINFAISAITGTSTSLNPFAGPVATVFGGKENPSDAFITVGGQKIKITRPFSGKTATGSTTNVPACRQANSNWQRGCTTLQAYCADDGTSGTGRISNIQTALNTTFTCDCGTTDGCFGDQTINCVRRFQIANNLPPTGLVDSATNQLLAQPSQARGCGTDLGGYTAKDVVAVFPVPTPENAATAPTSSPGCCVVQTGDNPLYCLDQLSAQGCAALGAETSFFSGVYCASSPLSPEQCGYCSATSSPTCSASNGCFQEVSKYWCENVAHQRLDPSVVGPPGPLNFQPNRCSGSNCTSTVLLSPPQ